MLTVDRQETAEVAHTCGLTGDASLMIRLESDEVHKERLQAMLPTLLTKDVARQLSREVSINRPCDPRRTPKNRSGDRSISVSVAGVQVSLHIEVTTRKPQDFEPFIWATRELLVPILAGQLTVYKKML